MRCVMIMAGGTGGHIMPALAVAQVLHARGVRIVWMGSRRGLEAKLARKFGYAMQHVRIKGVRKSGMLRKLLLPLDLSFAVLQAIYALAKHQPHVLLGMGGFISAPGGLAAMLFNTPLVLHEQNCIAGLTNRYLARRGKRRLSGFPEARGINETEWVGNPVRREILAVAEPEKRLANRTGDLRVLVLGGSQGARVFNRELPKLFARGNISDLEVWHQSGRDKPGAVGDAYLHAGVTCQVNDFIGDMAAAYAWADIVICRAGAMTLAELCAAGAAAILVPYPHAVNDHQAANAEYMVQSRAAMMWREDAFVKGEWLDVFADLRARRDKILRMACAARKLAKPDAAEAVAHACMEAAGA